MYFNFNYKPVLFLLPFVIFLFPVFIEAQNCSVSQDGLKGIVKSCETIYFAAQGNSSRKKYCSYDKSGRKIFETEYLFPTVHWIDSSSFYFSPNGDTIKTNKFYHAKKKPLSTTISVYDQNGFIREWNLFEKKSKKVRVRKEYFYQDKMLVADSESGFGFYNHWQIAEKYFIDSNNFLAKKETRIRYQFDTPENSFVEFKNDSAGNDTTEFFYYFNAFASGFQVDYTIQREFDTYGNVIRYFKTDKFGKVLEKYSVTYEYDLHGNWIKKTQAFDQYRENYPPSAANVKIVATRKIEYY